MKRSLLLLVAVACFAVATACGHKKVALETSSSQPAAEAHAELGHDSNGNQELKLTARHLARPQNLTPAKDVYVVWIQPRGEQPINQGALRVNDDLKAEFRAKTAYKNFDIFVTAEDSATASYPSGQEVMRQHLQEK